MPTVLSRTSEETEMVGGMGGIGREMADSSAASQSQPRSSATVAASTRLRAPVLAIADDR